MYKFKVCLVKTIFIFLGKVEYWNKNYIWFSFTKLDMYLVHRVFLWLGYACGFSMGTCILSFLVWVFHEHFICVYFYWGKFLIVFSSLDFDIQLLR